MSAAMSLSLYLHIPFCSTKCSYCAFNTYTDLEGLIDTFVTSLANEVYILAANAPAAQVGTIYFGGGTPSLLRPEQFGHLLQTIVASWHVSPDAEITFEANPNDLHESYLYDLRKVGLNRISIGMQTAIPSELRLFNRRHDTQMVVDAVKAARVAGFDNLSLDLIYGIPHQTLENWQHSLRQALDLQIEHISLYALGLEGGTPLKDDVDAGRLPDPDDDLAADMYDVATEILESEGFEQYEISNWAKPGYESRHNLQYWLNLPYAGLGPGAHGYAGGYRYSVVLSPQKYIQLMQNPAAAYEFPRTPATARIVPVDGQTEIAETLMMGLRLTKRGINRAEFKRRFAIDVVELHADALLKFERHGIVTIDDEAVRLTKAGRFLSNAVIRELV